MKITSALIILLLLNSGNSSAAIRVDCNKGDSNYMKHTGLINIHWTLQDTLGTDGIYTDMNAAVIGSPTMTAHSYMLADFMRLVHKKSLEYSVITTAPAPIEFAATSFIYTMRIAPDWPNGIPTWNYRTGFYDFCENVVETIP